MTDVNVRPAPHPVCDSLLHQELSRVEPTAAERRALERERFFSRNFYVLDTETNGFSFYEPIEIAALRFEEGEQVGIHSQYFLPENEITRASRKIHGLTRKKLHARGARRISEGDCRALMRFLNEHQDWPIVAHYAKHDRDQVLMPAFKKAGIVDKMPDKGRWRCTLNMSERVPDLEFRDLDSLLKHFGF